MAQNTNWDKVLDEYERICNECIIIRTRIVQGESVSYSSVTAIVKKLSGLRSSLQESRGSMNPDQVRRFSQIRDRYGAVMGTFSPSGMDDLDSRTATVVASDGQSAAKTQSASRNKGNQAERPAVTGVSGGKDSAEMSDSLQLGGKDFLNLLEDETAQTFLTIQAAGSAISDPSGLTIPPSTGLVSDNLEYKAQIKENPNPCRYFVLASLEMGRKPSFGAMFGLVKGRLGGYIQGRSNFKNAESVKQVYSNGTILPGNETFNASGKSAYKTWNVTIGPMLMLADWFYLYAGAGYGKRRLSWQDTSGKWMEVKDFSSKGIAVEGGALVSYKSVCVGLGLCYLGEMDATAVIGIRF